MRRHRHLATFFCLLGLWLQMMAPALALGAQRHAFDPRSAICHGSPSDQGSEKAPAPQAPHCGHCLLCHALTGGLPPDGRPVFTRLDFPPSSPLRWLAVAASVPVSEACRDAQPRGPPTLV